MKFQILTTALYASLAIASAIPQPNPLPDVDSRVLSVRGVDNKPNKDWECPTADKDKTVTYKKAEIIKAIEQGIKLAKDGKTVGPDGQRKFPYPVSNPGSLPGIPDEYKDSKNVQHFPMKNGKSAYSGSRPPKDERVMYLHKDKDDDATFIGLWTHAGAETGQYQQCHEKS